MVEHGARHIVLLSRSGGGKAALEELCDEARAQHPDARLVVQKCDASDEDQVRQMVRDVSKTFPPICGVIHAAMVLRVSANLLQAPLYLG
jgi:NAD(P)-dependent dehydrogenase (short-subunit alcohol dehydrogenase family)